MAINEILHDIERLKNIKQSVGQFSVSTIQSFIQDIIDEKQKAVNDFEKQAPSHIQELCNNLRGDK